MLWPEGSLVITGFCNPIEGRGAFSQLQLHPGKPAIRGADWSRAI